MYESILISQFPKCISILSHFIKSWNASQACLIVVFCGEHIFQTRKLILQVQRQPLYCNFLPKATRSWELEKCNVWCRWKSFNSHFMRSPEGSGPPKVTTIPYVFMNFDALVYIMMICPVLQASVDAEQHCTLWHMWHLWHLWPREKNSNTSQTPQGFLQMKTVFEGESGSIGSSESLQFRLWWH